MFEDPNAGGGVTSDPPVGTGGGSATSDPTADTSGAETVPTEDVSGFEDPTLSTAKTADSDPPVGTGGG